MAIVQISRITNRKGLRDDLPNPEYTPLAGAELGWATNTRQLFIGNGTLEEGAPAVGYTEILTEFTDIFALKRGYVYQGLAGGYVVQTGPTADNPVNQTLQARLDSYAIATDFGIIGDGSTDNTLAINHALYELYCRDAGTPATRRKLFFPAGIYMVSGTLLIPSFATLYGDSTTGSVISFMTENWSDLVAYSKGTTVNNEGAYYVAIQDVPYGTGLTDTSYWNPVAKPDYIWRTADSNQNVGTSIGLDNGIPPTGISVVDLTFTTDLETDAVLMQDVSNSTFVNVSVVGPWTKDNISPASPDTRAIDWSSTPIYVCKNNKFIGCSFRGFKYATSTDQQLESNVFKDCDFDTLYQGIDLGGDDPVLGGATGTKIFNNTFNNIYHQAITLTNVALNATGYNIFYDVGNEFNGIANPVTAIIEFDAENNVSLGDMFARSESVADATGIPCIDIHNKVNIGLEGANRLKLGSYHRDSGIIAVLSDSQTDAVLFTVDATEFRALAIDYTITRGVNCRTGRFTVVASTDGNNTDLTYDYAGIQNADTGVTLTAFESASMVSVLYSTTAIAMNGQISYSVVKLA